MGRSIVGCWLYGYLVKTLKVTSIIGDETADAVGQHYGDDIGVVDLLTTYLVLAYQVLQKVGDSFGLIEQGKSRQKGLHLFQDLLDSE